MLCKRLQSWDMERTRWDECLKRVEHPVSLFYRDHRLVWRPRNDAGVSVLGEDDPDAPTIDQVWRRPDKFRVFDEHGCPRPHPKFRWLRDPAQNRTVSVHHCAFHGDFGPKHNQMREYGVWTGAGFYSLGYKTPLLGLDNQSFVKVTRGFKSVTVKPIYVRSFVETRWGYAVPRSVHAMIEEYLVTGDLFSAYVRTKPRSPRLKRARSETMRHAKKTLNSPTARLHLAHRLADRMQELTGETVIDFIAEEAVQAVRTAKGEKKIPGLKFLMEIQDAAAAVALQARADAEGIMVSGDIEPGLALPMSGVNDQFSTSQLAAWKSDN